MISSNPFSFSSPLAALAQGSFVPSLVGDIGFGTAFGPSTSGLPSWGLGDILALTQGPMYTLDQFWQMYAGGLGQSALAGMSGAPAADTKAAAVASAETAA